MELPQLALQGRLDRHGISDGREPQGLFTRSGIQFGHLLLDVLGNVLMDPSQGSLTRHI